MGARHRSDDARKQGKQARNLTAQLGVMRPGSESHGPSWSLTRSVEGQTAFTTRAVSSDCSQRSADVFFEISSERDSYRILLLSHRQCRARVDAVSFARATTSPMRRVQVDTKMPLREVRERSSMLDDGFSSHNSDVRPRMSFDLTGESIFRATTVAGRAGLRLEEKR